MRLFPKNLPCPLARLLPPGEERAPLRAFLKATLLLFVATRLADAVHAVCGLWVVPRWIPPAELGAILPMLGFGAAVAVPFGVFLTVFVRSYARFMARGELRRARQIGRWALGLSLLLAVLTPLAAWPLLPWLFRILRTAPSAAGALAALYGLVMAFLPVAASALQARKRFGAMAAANLAGAPLRLAALLLLLPVLGMTGYFLGQLTPALVTLLFALWVLGRERREPCPETPVAAEPLGRADLREMCRYGLRILVGNGVGALGTFAVALLIRARMTDEASGAYYLLTRFAEIAAYCTTGVTAVLFPFAVEAHAAGRSWARTGAFAALAVLLGSLLLAGLFLLLLPPLFRLLPAYAPYVGAAPWGAYLTAVTGLNMALSVWFTRCSAENDFGYLRYTVPLTGVNVLLFWFLADSRLQTSLHLLFVCALLQAVAVLLDLTLRRRRTRMT